MDLVYLHIHIDYCGYGDKLGPPRIVGEYIYNHSISLVYSISHMYEPGFYCRN